MSRINRPPVSISRVKVHAAGKPENTIVVVVGDVINDERMLEVPKLSIAALRFSSAAKDRVTKAGGRCFTFDELALERPTGINTFILQGERHAREAVRHFRGVRGAKVVPYTRKRGAVNRGPERTHTRKKAHK